jgi:hypothetical protein
MRDDFVDLAGLRLEIARWVDSLGPGDGDDGTRGADDDGDDDDDGPTLRWMVLEYPPGHAGGEVPEWLVSAALASDGRVLAPAALAGPEWTVLGRAAWDGTTSLAVADGHAYLWTGWMAREFPEAAAALIGVDLRVRAYFERMEEDDDGDED